jgi:peptidyl-prolyl cis-trans isomerase B (cyclophilin B)
MRSILHLVILTTFLFTSTSLFAQPQIKVKKADQKKDILMITSKGKMILRLSDLTTLHRDNFIRLIKSKYYENISFHRVISGFMIQAGDEKTKPRFDSSKLLNDYTIPAEFNVSLFHKRGVLAAARMGDDVNPSRASSGVQFYIVQGKTFTDKALDSVETHRLEGVKLPKAHRDYYKKYGGTPQLDQHYTVFGELVTGYDVLDAIASVETTGKGKGDKPLEDIRIKKTKLIKRSL